MSQDVKAAVESHLNTADLCRVFDCTPMTIYLWRRDKKMPFIKINIGRKNLILYDWGKVKAWADKYGKIIIREFTYENDGP